eukprot:jgi/Mesvir1/24312/Mv10999-RA.3
MDPTRCPPHVTGLSRLARRLALEDGRDSVPGIYPDGALRATLPSTGAAGVTWEVGGEGHEEGAEPDAETNPVAATGLDQGESVQLAEMAAAAPARKRARSKGMLRLVVENVLQGEGAQGLEDKGGRHAGMLAHARVAGALVVGSFFVSLVLGSFYLWLLRAYPQGMVHWSVVGMVLAPFVCGAALIATSLLRYGSKAHHGGGGGDHEGDEGAFPQGMLVTGAVLILVSLVLGGIMYWLRARVELTAKLLGLAAVGMHDNPFLALLLVALKLVMLLACASITVLGVVAFMNGQLAPNPALDPNEPCGPSSDEPCCVWQPDSWVPAYLALCGTASVWVALLLFEMRIFVVGGCIAQWYVRGRGPGVEGTTRRSLGHALGPSFGTLCFASLLLTLVQLVKTIIDRWSQEARRRAEGAPNLLLGLATCCVNCLLACLQFLTKFATIFAAISGKAFLDSAACSADLLTRNLLSAVVVDRVGSLILNLASVVMAVIVGSVTFVVLNAFWLHDQFFDSTDTAKLAAACVAVICAVIVLTVLLFFSTALLSVVDTLYLCFAMDKDAGVVTDMHVHEVFFLLLPPGRRRSISGRRGFSPLGGGSPRLGSPGAPAAVVGDRTQYHPPPSVLARG